MKFYYVDLEGDIISVTNTDDLVEALKEDRKLKMTICENREEAKMILSQAMFDNSIVSELGTLRSDMQSAHGSSLGRIGDLSRASLV